MTSHLFHQVASEPTQGKEEGILWRCITQLQPVQQLIHKLFELVNIIAAKMITEPNEINKLFDGLPEGKKVSIQKREGQ